MAMQKEQGTCFGRGFADVDTDGWLAKFKTWIVKVPASGGPGWVILRDASTLPVAQTITAVDTGLNTLTISSHPFKTGDYVLYQSTGTAIGGLINNYSYVVAAVDGNTLQLASNYNFRQDLIQTGTYTSFSSSGTGTHTLTARGPFITIAESTPSSANDPKKILHVGYHTDEAGYIYVYGLYGWDSTEGNGLYHWSAQRIKSVDAGNFVYDFRGGEEFLCLQSYIASEPAWYHVMIDNWTGLTNFTDPSTVIGTIQSSLTCNNAGPEVIPLTDSAEASLFTKNNWYFVYDFRDYCVRVTYAECTGVGVADGLNADEIQLENIQALNYVSTKTGDTSNTLNSGAIICAYAHRYVLIGNGEINTNIFNAFSSTIPYMDYNNTISSANVIHANSGGIIYSSVSSSRDYNALTHGNPQDNSTYIVQKPLIVSYTFNNTQYSNTLSMTESWGEPDNMYLTSSTGMTKMSTGRIIDEGSGNEEWVSIGDEIDTIYGGSASISVLIPNTEST